METRVNSAFGHINVTKGLYKRFHNGEDIKLAGLTEKYEKPDNADLVCNTDTETIQECVTQILAKISSVWFIYLSSINRYYGKISSN